MSKLKALTYETTGRIARITLNRPEAGFKQAVRERDEQFGDPGFE